MEKIEEKNDGLSRRGFLTSAAAVAGGAMLVGLAGCAPDSGNEGGDSASKPAGSGNTGAGTTPEAMTGKAYQGKWAFEIPPDPIPESDIARTVEADVVVVGGGASGFVTAVSAAQEGLKVAMVTASTKPISRGGSNFGVYSKVMEKYGVPRCDPNSFHKEIAMNYNAVDQRKWYKLFHTSEEAMNWAVDLMEAHGIETALECPANIAKDDIYYVTMGSHGFINSEIKEVGMGQSLLVNALADELTTLGGTIDFSMVGKQLVRGTDNASGRVSALIAQDKDGSYVRYEAKKAVVLATGDFSADRDMMYRYSPWAAQLVSDEVYDAEPDYDKEFFYGGLFKGDGQKMGLWVGAAWQKTIPNAPNAVTNICGPVQNAYQNYFGLLVNRDGQRFSNEYSSCTLGFLAGWMQPGDEDYALWTPEYIDAVPNDWYPGYAGYKITPEMSREEVIAGWDAQVENGGMVKGETIEDVINALGLPLEETVATVNRYNELCAKGVDEDFFKRSDMMFPVKNGPFYGQRNIGPMFLTITGGLRTNENMQVCDANDNAIEGLYNVGTMVGDFYAGMYTFQIPGVNYGGCCLTFGYLTGKYIAENE